MTNVRARFEQVIAGLPYYEQGGQARRAKPVDLEYFYGHLWEFTNPSPVGIEARDIGLDWKPQRVTALQPWFHLEPQIQVLRSASLSLVRKSRPQCLVGPVDALRKLAKEAPGSEPLEYGVVAFTGVGRALLSEQDRDLFWRAFGAPVFQQFRGFEGELLASECDLHDGMHIQSEAGLFEEPGWRGGSLLLTSLVGLKHPVMKLETGFSGVVDAEVCGCGNAAPRLRHLRPLSRRKLYVHAAAC